MRISDLSGVSPNNKPDYRKGRGYGSGNGKTGGRGHKGQKARAGGGVRPGFEGGQMPIYMRMPKIGFNNYEFRTNYAEVKVSDLNAFENGDVVTAEALIEKGVIKKKFEGIKILGNGEITKNLTVQAAKFTKTASEKIVAAGGKAEVL
jgi:large subunit ribosomal protein L15